MARLALFSLLWSDGFAGCKSGIKTAKESGNPFESFQVWRTEDVDHPSRLYVQFRHTCFILFLTSLKWDVL